MGWTTVPRAKLSRKRALESWPGSPLPTRRSIVPKSKSPTGISRWTLGTTFTTVAFYRRGTPIERIHTIDNFPGEKQHNQTHRQIPTELWYPQKNTRLSGLVKQRDIRTRFGNEVHRVAEHDEAVDVHKIYEDADRVIMMKLLVEKSDYAQASNERLREMLDSIKAKGHIHEDEDIFFHFFREIFRASNTRLGSDFDENSSGMLHSSPRYAC